MKRLKDPCIYLDFVLIRKCLIVNGVTHIIKYARVELILLTSSNLSLSLYNCIDVYHILCLNPSPKPPTSTTS